MPISLLWAFLAVALPVLASLLATLPATDLTYHLRAGTEILGTGRVPVVDTWTFTAAGLPWVDQQWAAQVLLATVDRLGGWTGLVLLRAALVGLIFGALLVLARRRGLSWRTSAWLTLGAFVVAAPALALRPQLLGMALFSATLLLVADRTQHPGRLWLIPLIGIVWANVHGSFFLAPAVLGLAWLADVSAVHRKRHLPLLVAGVTAVASCLTPFGPGVWTYALSLGSNPEVTSWISEWQPTSLREPAGLMFFASAGLIVAYLARRGGTDWATIAWFGFFAVLGLYAVRGIAWWALAAVAAVAPLVARERDQTNAPDVRRSLRLANAGIAIAAVLAGIALLPLFRPLNAAGIPAGVVSQAPAGLTAALRETAGTEDRLLNHQPWGSWFEHSIPSLPVAVDSRIELFPSEVWRDYVGVMTGSVGWERTLERWGVTLVALEGPASGAAVRRFADAGWHLVVEDSEGVILAAPNRQ